MHRSRLRQAMPAPRVNPGRSVVRPSVRDRVSRLCLTPHILLLISTLIYFSPFFLQSLEYLWPASAKTTLSYSFGVGFAVFLVLFMILIFAFAIRHRAVDFSVAPDYGAEAKALTLLMVGLLIYVVLQGNIFIANKQEMLEETGRADLVFYQLSSISIIFCALVGFKRERLILILSICGLLLILYAGHRSAIAISILGILYIRFRNTPITRKFFVFSLVAGLFFVILSVYKSVYQAIKVGNWEIVADRLAAGNFVDSAFIGMEQFVTFAHLDFIITSDFRLSCSNAWMIPFSIIPFTDEILGSFIDFSQCDYNSQVQPVFFPEYVGGVAANIWAEFYGYFGYFGLPIIVLILSGFFYFIESLIRGTRSPILMAGLIVALVNMSFYIQRKEILGGFISAKRAVTIAIIVFVVAWMFRVVTSSRRMR